MYCCGPASVNGILQGEALLKYDMPFVFAEVNADIVKWMVSEHTWSYNDENFGTCKGVKTPQIIRLFYSIFSMLLFFPRPCSHPQVTARGLKKKMHSDTKTVGQNISTKAVGSNMRNDITDSYKHREGKDWILWSIYLLCKKYFTILLGPSWVLQELRNSNQWNSRTLLKGNKHKFIDSVGSLRWFWMFTQWISHRREELSFQDLIRLFNTPRNHLV